METNIKKWGNSQGILLSKKLLNSVGITDPINHPVDVDVEDDKIIIHKIDSKLTIKDLFKNFDREKYFKENSGNREIDWGEPVGREVW